MQKKFLGQHFLTDIHIAESICNLLDKNTKKVVEIGPGMGVLTQFLIKKYQTKLIEIDKESIIYLQKKWSDLNIIEGDFLAQDLNQIMKSKFSIIGNFPYNISNQILFKTFEHRKKVNELVGMFQKEVAERIVCKRGKKRHFISFNTNILQYRILYDCTSICLSSKTKSRICCYKTSKK